MNNQKQQLLIKIDELERKRELLLTLQASIDFNYNQLKRALSTLLSGYQIVVKRGKNCYQRFYTLAGPDYQYKTYSYTIYTSNSVKHLNSFIESELLMTAAILEHDKKELSKLCQTL